MPPQTSAARPAPGKPAWQQVTALVTLGAGGAVSGLTFVPKALAGPASPAGLPVRLAALARPAASAPTSDSRLRSAIVNVARYYLRLARSRTPAEMQALIWQADSPDGADHGPSCAAFASLTLELAARAVGERSWVTGGTTYPWPLHPWVDARVDPNPSSPGIVSILTDAKAHHRWHPLGDGYRPLPGDWVLFDGHVEVVTGYGHGVLHTIGGDSLPNFSVNAHDYHDPLSAAGVIGFVNNGHLPKGDSKDGRPVRGHRPATGGPATPGSAPAPGTPGPGTPGTRGTPGTPGSAPKPGTGGPGTLGPVAPGEAASGQAPPSRTSPGQSAPKPAARGARAGGADIPGLPAAGPHPHGAGGHRPHRATPGRAVYLGVPRRVLARAHPARSGQAGTASVPGLPPAEPAPGQARHPAASQAGEPQAQPPQRSPVPPQRSPVPPQRSPVPPQRSPVPSAPASPGQVGMSAAARQAFIAEVAPGARATQRRYGIPASVTIAQAIEESGWGQSSLARQDHNLFGIKGTGPAGSVMEPTTEFQNGTWVQVTAPFRVYHSIAESIEDHGRLLATSGYYQQAMAHRGDPNAFANALTGVYATDPNYGTKLIRLMREYNLYRFDLSASQPGTPVNHPGPGQRSTEPGAAGQPLPRESASPRTRAPAGDPGPGRAPSQASGPSHVTGPSPASGSPRASGVPRAVGPPPPGRTPPATGRPALGQALIPGVGAPAASAAPASAAQYSERLPSAVQAAFVARARTPILRTRPLYADIAAQHGIPWELLAACDWMQCQARARYSPVHGERLGTVNPDGSCYRTRSHALDQCAADLVSLARAVYQLDLTAGGPLSVGDLARTFAAFRWGGLLRAHHISALEFPYSVAGLTDHHRHMRWPDIAEPKAPDRPGSRFRQPFGAVPVVLLLGYPATE
jgi:flagellum-specific peptidoglycan hydrolase FlgJ